MATTRRLLERVPDDRFEWRPHQRSMSLGGLASHIVRLAGQDVLTLDRADVVGVTGATPPAEAASRAALLEMFDTNVGATRSRLTGRSDAELTAVWTMSRGSDTLFTMPRASAFRVFVMNHVIHHRGQLSVYLRLNDVPVPSIYGPSADEAL